MYFTGTQWSKMKIDLTIVTATTIRYEEYEMLATILKRMIMYKLWVQQMRISNCLDRPITGQG